MTGQTKSICHYHKYGYCKAKNECERFHSSRVCSKQICDVKSCSDRHPQQCKFYASQGFCKFGDSCMFDHKTTDHNKTLKAELEDLKMRHEEVIRVTSRHEETIKLLQYQINQFGSQMIGAVREMSEYFEEGVKENENVEQMDFENAKRKKEENLDSSYDICDDAQFKEIMDKQEHIASELETGLEEIKLNLKKKKVEETLASLTNLHLKIKKDEKEMKRMLEKDIRYLEYYNYEQEIVMTSLDESGNSYVDENDDWYPKMDEMFRFFDEMMKNIEKLPGNNFKKGAELEIVKMKCMAEEMKENRSSEIFRKFR